MKLAVIGSRGFNSYDILKEVIQDLFKENITTIISGGAKGADSLGELYAKKNNIPTIIFKADWAKYRRGAGHIRNTDIINNADVILAFWDMESPGTKNSINKAKKLGKKVYIYNTKTNIIE